MKTWIPRLIMAGFACMLAYAFYWGYGMLKEQREEIIPASAAELKASDRQLVKSYNEFGKALFREAAQEPEGSGNVFLSTYSVAAALSMVYNGASGLTAEELAKVLRYPAAGREDISSSGLAIMDATIQNTNQAEVRIANSMWARKGWAFSPYVLELNSKYYKSQLGTLDFSDEASAEKMNEWVKEHTKGRINRMIEPPIDPTTVSILLNAVYFKGQWTKPFEESQTSSKPFKLEQGGEKSVPMMAKGDLYSYYGAEEVQAVRLPYEDERLGMNVYVPGNKTGTLENLVAWLLENGGLEAVQNGYKERQGSVELPRFKLEYTKELNETLARMGIREAFNSESTGLNGMLQKTSEPQIGNLYIGSVLHKSYVEVNERGTEAAAATKIEMRAGSAAPAEEPFQFAADRPFFFTIEDRATGLILFMGMVKEP